MFNVEVVKARGDIDRGDNSPPGSPQILLSPKEGKGQGFGDLDWKKKADFDIYLNEALVPVLAQALDALCRQLVRNEQNGNNLDPKQNDRFNPLTWLGQQLLRRHPRCARTPRRQELYKSFSYWSDCERGRREILRRREEAQNAFGEFATGADHGVKKSSIPFVVADLDDKLQLEGSLMHSSNLREAFEAVGAWHNTSEQDGQAATAAKRKKTVKVDKNWPFEDFWNEFTKCVLNFDIITNTTIKEGALRLEKQAEDRREQAEAQQRLEEFKEQLLEEERQAARDFGSLKEELRSDDFIRQVLDENKILTGDDIRPGDLGFELEIPPHGRHCFLLAKALSLVGFKEIDIESMEGDGETWWTQGLSSKWAQFQKIVKAELADGVVEKGSLIDLLVEDDETFLSLRRRVEDEVERLETTDHTFLTEKDMEGEDLRRGLFRNTDSSHKPSIEKLSQTLGLTVARLKWLHSLFEGFLVSEDVDGPPPKCNYPEDPASLSKDQMKGIMLELFPQTTDPEFEAHFRRIDEDGSGEVEFDEFVTWLAENQINLTGTSSRKMTCGELAEFHDVSEELIIYLLSCFQDCCADLDPPVVDEYPKNPAKLAKQEVRKLVEEITPDLTDIEFEANWEFANANSEGGDAIDFSDFLEMVDFEALPEGFSEKAAAFAAEAAIDDFGNES